MSLSIAKPLTEILEKEWEATLYASKTGLCPMLGWRLQYHTLRSKGSRSGFPDRVLVRERVIFAESKREKGSGVKPPSAEQIEWLDGLTRAGMECYLWRPSDLDEVARILSKRWVFLPNAHDTGVGRLQIGDEWWIPRSLWVSGRGVYGELAEEDQIPGQTSIPVP